MGESYSSGSEGQRSRSRGFLLSTTFLLALLGAVGGISDAVSAVRLLFSYVQNVDQLRYIFDRDAYEMVTLSRKNEDCITTVPSQQFTAPNGDSITFQACPSHDVFISVYNKGQDPYVKWIVPSRGWGSNNAGLLLNQAYAGNRAEPPARLLLAQNTINVSCLKWTGPSKFIRILNEAGQCFKETVDAISGKVQGRVPIACDAKCE